MTYMYNKAKVITNVVTTIIPCTQHDILHFGLTNFISLLKIVYKIGTFVFAFSNLKFISLTCISVFFGRWELFIYRSFLFKSVTEDGCVGI